MPILSYISALGAHRDKLDNKVILDIFDDAVCYIDIALKSALIDDDGINQLPINIVKRIEQAPAERNSKEQLVLQQTGLLIELSPEIVNIIKQINQL
ncbi:Inner membrane protein YccS [Photorhabdus namnaonensis]|uniref:Inner membrane protein YccS n=1 Tax=Photorhabdus namnaonensis TaxID=1851568 RepID=A0A1B8YG95_9GAMM|nr:Inner membrane protein YccS [Photorhabdus namnaonensis]